LSKDIVELKQDQLDFLRRYSELIVQHRLTQTALETAMQKYLSDNLSIDISTEEWELDLARGLIRLKKDPSDDGLDREQHVYHKEGD
jgi:hypothetical protein